MIGRLFISLACFFLLGSSVLANPVENQEIQSRINNIGCNLLNSNKIEHRVVFVYSEQDKQNLLDIDKALPSGQVVVYKNIYQSAETDDELAAGIARGVIDAVKSQKGFWNGTLNAIQIKAAPKKYELVADKRAVDFMVKAGFNPVGLIIFINKTAPQKRHDLISNKNLVSKRLAIVYEYIYTKYPYYLANNPYINNKHYQNFLLTSQNNRKLLEEKIKSGSKEKLHYE